MRTTSTELLDAWREGEIDVDCADLAGARDRQRHREHRRTARQPRQTDIFAEGRVQVVEFDVPTDASGDAIVGRSLRQAGLRPIQGRCADSPRSPGLPRGEVKILPADRVVVIASPESARAWSRLLAHEERTIDDIVIFGAGRMGTTIGRVLLARGMRVRLVDADPRRAHDAADDLPEVRVFHADAFDSSFLQRQRKR